MDKDLKASIAEVQVSVASPRRAVPARGSSEVTRVSTGCANCNLREICIPCGLTGREVDQVEELIYARRHVKRGESLYRAADAFNSLYAVRSGFFKTSQTLEDGREQITAFYMAGEIMGMDGIGPERHSCNAVPLEDSQVCVILYSRLEVLSRHLPGLQQQFHKVMSREIAREHGVMLLLGSMHAEERLAAFVLNLSQRFAARRYSGHEFVLRMTRGEIGSYLGLKLETVSRAFSKFQEEGLISVRHKRVGILDATGLKRMIGRGLR